MLKYVNVSKRSNQCTLCNTINLVSHAPPQGLDMAHIRCGGCGTLLMYTCDATSVRRSCCQTLNLAPDRVETNLKESIRDMSLFKFKYGAVVAFVLFVVFGLLNSLFEWKVVAKLPFHPITIVRKMSHRGLKGEDSTDCSEDCCMLLVTELISPS